jgi:uncharacterized protein (DUF433 family)
MKLHGNARTCPKSRRLLVDRLEGGWSLTQAAEAAGVSERTAAKWLARWRAEGEVGGGRRGTLAPMAQERITVDLNRMRGLSSIRDTRVTVSAVLGQLAAGASIDELLADYPYLEREDVLAALEYAAAAAQERELAVVAPAA